MNPRDKRPGDRRTLGSGNRPGTAVWYVLGALLVMALMQAWFLAPSGRQISYSDFKQAVRGGEVAEVTIGAQVVRGTTGATSTVSATSMRRGRGSQNDGRVAAAEVK